VYNVTDNESELFWQFLVSWKLQQKWVVKVMRQVQILQVRKDAAPPCHLIHLSTEHQRQLI